MANNKEKKTVRKVCFQTSTDSSVEEEAMKTFLVFESGDSGDLSFNEFQQAVDEMGMDLEAKKVQNLFRQVDTDGNGKVDFEEFLKLMKHKQKKTATKESEDPNMQIFQMFDKDGSGSLSSQEWLEVMNLMGLKTTKEEAAQLFSSVDKNGDGRIGLQEFISYIGN
eukprot:GFUD01017026.1.p1 GENE.GFUD01017026.1~~GFUD01017026.1.p1  ORF type:complete len:166 (-),score=59.46 GFUD01017026.1:227-724(-)